MQHCNQLAYHGPHLWMRIGSDLKQPYQTVFIQPKSAGLDKHNPCNLLCRSCWHGVQQPVHSHFTRDQKCSRNGRYFFHFWSKHDYIMHLPTHVQVKSRQSLGRDQEVSRQRQSLSRVQVDQGTESRQRQGTVQVECRQSLSRVQVQSLGIVQVESKQSQGRVQVESISKSIGGVQVESRQCLGRVQVESRQSLGSVQVESRQSLGRDQVESRWSLGRVQVESVGKVQVLSRQSLGRCRV